MPNNWLAVDSNLPDLSRVANPKEQIQLLFNYMVELTGQLRYSLQNLSASNWNAAALNELKNTAGKDALKAVEQLRNQLTQISATVGSYSGRINAIENAISQIEAAQETLQEDVSKLQVDVSDHEVRLEDLENLVNGESGIVRQLEDIQGQVDGMQQNLDRLTAVIQETDAGNQIGEEGKELHLVGTVYINGVLLEQEGETQ